MLNLKNRNEFISYGRRGEKFMFNSKENFYVTSGVKESIHPIIISEMIESIFRIKNSMEVDYLQIFNIVNEQGKIRIKHFQEVPEFEEEFIIKGIPNEFEGTVYIIDDLTHSTVLLSDEY